MDPTTLPPTDLFQQLDALPNEDLFAPPPKSGSQIEAEGALATADPALATSSEAQVNEAVLSLSKYSREVELEQGIRQGTANNELLTRLQADYNLPDPDAAVVGAVHAMAEPEEDVSHITPSSVKSGRARLGQLAAELHAQTKGEYPLAYAAEQKYGKVAGVAAVLGDITGNVLYAAPSQAIVTALQTEFPGEVSPEARLNVGTLLTDFQTRMIKLVDEGKQVQAEGHLRNVVSTIVRNLHSGAYQSDVGAQQAVETLTSGLMELVDNPNAKISNKLNGAFSYLEMVPLGSAAIRGVRAITLAGTDVTRATVAAGLVPGSSNALIAKTKAGAQALWDTIRSRATSTPRAEVQGAATTEDIIDSLALPKINGVQVGDEPFILANLLPEARRAELAADPAYVFGAHMVPRMNATTLATEVTEGGVRGSVQVGTKNGAPFKNAQVAQRAATRDLGGGTVVPNANGPGFFVEVTNSRQFGLADVNEAPDLTSTGYRVWRFFGKALGSTQFGIESSNVAARVGDVVQETVAKITKPYWSLPAGSQRRVAKVLDDGDFEQKLYTKAELYAKGLNDSEILGYAATRRMFDLQLATKNTELWHKATAKGFRGLSVNGKSYGMKVMGSVDEAVYAERGMSPKSIRAIDTETNSVTTLDNVPPNKVITRLMAPTQTGERYALVDRRDLAKMGDLPRQMVPSVPGFVPRTYKYSHYVDLVDSSTGVRTVLRPARSQLEADQIAEELRLTNPGQTIEPRRSRESLIEDDELEFEQLQDAGLLWSSSRGPSRLQDVSGGVRMTSVEDRIRQAQSDIAFSSGLQRWGLVQKEAWNARWGSLFEKPWSPGTPSGQLVAKSTVLDEKALAQARNEADFISNVLGVGKSGYQQVMNGTSKWLGDRLFNTATRLEGLTGGKSWFASKAFRSLGDNIVGNSGRLLSNAKSVPYFLYIASNPIRQLPLQMTLIPSYFGVRGAAKYAVTGGFSRDYAAITANGVYEGAGRWVGKLGGDKELIEQFQRSGVSDSINHHQLSSGIITDTGATATASRINSALEGTGKAFKAVGVDLGVRAEKLASWLVARNRWIQDNPGKKPTIVDERKWAALGEELSLNPNRSDQLPIQHGVLGLFTQFMSMQVKQIGRTLQALPFVPKGSLTGREYAQMAGINLLTYGIAGYGAKELGEKVLSDPMFDALPAAAREMMNEGLANYTLDAVLSAYYGEEVNTATTESFSPNVGVAGSVMMVPRLVRMVAASDYSELANSRWTAPSLGFGANVVDALSFSAAVVGAPPLPDPNTDAIKFATITKKWASLVPALNNGMKAIAAREMRAKFNGRGDPIAEASLGEATMAIFGVKTRDEMAAYELSLFQSGAFARATEHEIKTVRDHAYETSKWMFPLLDEMVDGKITRAEALSYLDINNDFVRDVLPPEYHDEYLAELRKQIDKRWTPKYNRVLEFVLNDAGTGRLPIDADAIEEVVKMLPDEADRDEARATLRRKLFGIGAE